MPRGSRDFRCTVSGCAPEQVDNEVERVLTACGHDDLVRRHRDAAGSSEVIGDGFPQLR